MRRALLIVPLLASGCAARRTCRHLVLLKSPYAGSTWFTDELFCSGNALSILSTYAIQFLIDLQRGTCEPLFSRRGHAPVAAFLVANIAFCFLLLVTYDGPYRRLDAEHDHDLRRSRASGDTMASLAPCDFDLSYADDPPQPAASPAAVV